MLYYNSPLRVGQILEPRSKTVTPKSRITDVLVSSLGMMWIVAPFAGGPEQRMTLSEIYAAFKFEV